MVESGPTAKDLAAVLHPVFCVVFGDDGRWLASGSGHWQGPCLGEVRIWEALAPGAPRL